MIGGAGRNTGKTMFACEVIRRLADRWRVVGVKVTTLTDREGPCPRGGQGCGACHSLTGDYQITEERAASRHKDTQQMLAAGAREAYWLRVAHEHLEDGVGDLLARIPRGCCVVCESNSARQVLEPGLFVVIRDGVDGGIKASCRQVFHLADRIVTRDGSGWDLSPQSCLYIDGRWAVRPRAAAILLAGGRSTRMGRDKGLLPIDGTPLVARVVDQLKAVFSVCLLSVRNADHPYGFLGLEAVPDEQPGRGPLMGILSGLRQSPCDLNFVCACDIPEIHLGFVLDMLNRAEGYDLVLPWSPGGRPEPLFAVYRRTVVPAAEAILREGGRRIVDLLDLVRVLHVPMPEGDWYHNLNTPADLLLMGSGKAPKECDHDPL
jgi:molybdopterin-guanine dinucleotide biosynthesis protein A